MAERGEGWGMGEGVGEWSGGVGWGGGGSRDGEVRGEVTWVSHQRMKEVANYANYTEAYALHMK